MSRMRINADAQTDPVDAAMMPDTDERSRIKTTKQGRSRAPLLAWFLFVLSLAFGVTANLLLVLTPPEHLPRELDLRANVLYALAMLAFAAVGALIASNYPE